MHSNHYRNKLTALLNSNNFHTTFAINNKLLIDEVVYMFFILGKTSVMEKKNSEIYVINAPLGGRLLDRGRLTQNSIQRGASIRYGAFIGSWAFIKSFTVYNSPTLNVYCYG